MSAGKTHTKASLALTAGFLIGGIATLDISAISYATGSLIGVLISSDTDVDRGYDADKYIRNKIGKWAEKIWDVIWWPYRKSLKHGGPLSHFPVVCTAGRILYLYGELIVLPHVIYYFAFHPQWDLWYVLEWYARLIVENYRVVLGLMGADTIHFFLDVLTKEHKEPPKKKKRDINPEYLARLMGGEYAQDFK